MDRQMHKAYLCGSLRNTKNIIVQLFKTELSRRSAGTSLRAGLLAGLVGVLALPVFGQQSNGDPVLELSPCELSLPGTGLTTPAECGWFEVAENPAEPEGRKIKLRVARVPAQGRTVEPDPLVLFAGGPGQAASEAWLIIAGALKKLHKSRDVILVDQRGTGQSNPLRCPHMEMAEALAVDWDQLGETTQTCLDGLDGDPRYYTTTIAMGDYDQVREALGYDQLNLLGVSYGTRAAQVYLRLFPEHVRSVVLDSVAPQTLALGSEHAIKLDQALNRVLESCESDQQCNTAYPDIAGSLDLLVQRLDEQPETVTVAHPLTGSPFTFEYDRDALASTIRFLTYSPETQAMLPLLIHEAANTKNYQRLASQMLITASGLTDSIASGMELSVICAEDFPQFPDDEGGVNDSELLMGDSMLKASRIQCGIWPRGSVPDDFHEPVVSDKPTLLLSGELDPVTPPEYAEQVSKDLSNSLHLVAPGQGHSVTGRGCTGDLVSDFIIAGHFDELETDCLNQLEASPWFMSLTGPNP
jgi:pimeloyl-ACP methyl ester carboxylesterase